MPLVVIWMVTYNHEDYIRAAIESVMAQKTSFSFKLLIGEDYSTDKTREICIELQKKYPDKIKLFLNERNLGANQNGINLYFNCFATDAKYIALLDGDDYWIHPSKLQMQVDFLEKNTEFSSCFHNTVTLKNGMEFTPPNNYTKQNYYLEDTLHYIPLFHTSSFVFRKNALTIPSWLSETISCDMSIFTIIAKQGPIKYIPESMSVYRNHDKGISQSVGNSGEIMYKKHIQRLAYLDEFFDYQYSKAIKKSLKHYKKELFNYTKLGKIRSMIKLRTRLKNIFRKFFEPKLRA